MYLLSDDSFATLEFPQCTSLTLIYCYADSTTDAEKFFLHFPAVEFLEVHLSSISAMATFATAPLRQLGPKLKVLRWCPTMSYYDGEIQQLGRDFVNMLSRCSQLATLKISAETLQLAPAAKLPSVRLLDVNQDDPLEEGAAEAYLSMVLSMCENLEVLGVSMDHTAAWERAQAQSQSSTRAQAIEIRSLYYRSSFD